MAAQTGQETEDKLRAYHAVTMGENTDSETLIKMYDDVSPEYEYVSTTHTRTCTNIPIHTQVVMGGGG